LLKCNEILDLSLAGGHSERNKLKCSAVQNLFCVELSNVASLLLFLLTERAKSSL